MRHLHAAFVTVLLGLPAGAGLAQETRPATSPPAPEAAAEDEVLSTIRAAVQPTETQMERIRALYVQLRSDQSAVFREMRELVRRHRGSDDPAARQSVRDARREARDRVETLNEQFLVECRALLADDQIDAWDDCADELDLGRRGRDRAGRRRGRIDRTAGPEVGAPAPDFELPNLEGNLVTLASLRGKPVVLEFGSYTCPIFRRKVESIEALRRAYGDAVHWVFVYTREAHPTDGRVSRINQRQGIEIPQHTSFEQRLECAQRCRKATDLRLRLLVDGLDDAVTEAYGGFPNRGYVIDAEGRVASRQVWIEAERVRETLDALLGQRTGGPEDLRDPEPPARRRRR